MSQMQLYVNIDILSFIILDVIKLKLNRSIYMVRHCRSTGIGVLISTVRRNSVDGRTPDTEIECLSRQHSLYQDFAIT